MIVSEPSGRWAVALRRELGIAVRVYETRTVGEGWEQLARSPHSLVVIELTAGNLEPFLTRMARREREFPASRVAVVADRSMAGHEWLAREAGAAMFLTSPRRVAQLAEVARRHTDAQPQPTDRTTEPIWSNLPWREHATHSE